MIVHIVCPFQTTETFKIGECFRCKYFEQNMNMSGGISVTCRKQKDRGHKLGFQSAYWSESIGKPDNVVVDGV